jgi:ABC-type glycerol-3-phosphate transport system substrate-binding protein
VVIRLRPLLVLVLLAALAGCSMPAQSTSSSSRQQAPRVRCLNNPNEGDTRPMLFLFCAETP